MIPLSYNLNGLRNLSIFDAIDAVKKNHYTGAELSLHKSQINPFTITQSETRLIKQKMNDSGLFFPALATGADTLLSEVRFEPSLICASETGRKKRIDLIKKAIDLANEWGIKIVNFASGLKDEQVSMRQSSEYLINAINTLLNHSDGITLAIEPEPGMFIETTTQAVELIDTINRNNFKLNLDIGHANCCEDDYVNKMDICLPYAVHAHIEDIKDRVHYHLIPGEGDIDFKEVLSVFIKHNYSGYLSVELYNHTDVYETALSKSYEKLKAELKDLNQVHV
ncbi:MAG: sugar phosphate isomerase/epimerase family protein [Ferruginibacter sp.]